MRTKPYVGDVGTVITVNTKTNLTTATLLQLHVLKPDGTQVIWNGTLYNTKYIRYTTGGDDLDISGDYRLQAYVELPLWRGHGDATTFRVYDLYE